MYLALFKKKTKDHPFFGKMEYSAGYWRGSKMFSNSNNEVEIVFESLDSAFAEECVFFWKSIDDDISSVASSVLTELMKFREGDDGEDQLIRIEQVHFIRTGKFQTVWGVSDSAEPDYDSAFSVEHIDGKISPLGISH